MLCTSKLEPTAPSLGGSAVLRNDDSSLMLLRRPSYLSLPVRSRRFALPSVRSENAASSELSVSSRYTSSVGSVSASFVQVSQWNLTQRHVMMLNIIACVVSCRNSSKLYKHERFLRKKHLEELLPIEMVKSAF